MQHALRALLYLAGQEGRGPVLGREIAAAEGIPRPYLAKILHDLRRRGFLRSTRGPGGGYALARPAGQIRVGEVLEALDGKRDLRTRCLLGQGPCTSAESCLLHEHWAAVRDRFSTGIASLTLRQVARSRAPRRKSKPGRGTRRRHGG